MWFFTIFILITWAQADLPDTCQPANAAEPLEVYLLTSGPGDGVYTKVGHSALWVSGGGKRETVFNWGAYDSSQDNFLFRFFMGDAEYKLAMMSRQYNLKRVKDNKQLLIAQHLDLSPNMKMMLAAELARLARPENHVYTYHWETQNCSTLIRDLINDSTNGALKSLPEIQNPPTRRFEVLRHLESLYWAWFGWHYMASNYGDNTYDRWSWMHIPQALYNGVDEANIQWEGDDQSRPLVDRHCVLNEGEWAPPEPPHRKWILWCVGGMMGLWIWTTRNRGGVWQIPTMVWFGTSGFLSSFFMACWLLSPLDGYGFNENWFFSNPLHLIILYQLLHKRHMTFFVHTLWLFPSLGLLWKLSVEPTQSNIDFIGLFGIPCLLMVLAQHRYDHDHLSGQFDTSQK